MTIERTRRRFTPEFRKDAVALVTEQGRTVAKAARLVRSNFERIANYQGYARPYSADSVPWPMHGCADSGSHGPYALAIAKRPAYTGRFSSHWK